MVKLTFLNAVDVALNGNDTTYMRYLTHRYVGDELRFLTADHRSRLYEFRPATSTIRTAVRTWNIAPYTDAFFGIWFEQEKNRLWVTSGPDYTANYVPGRVSILTLNDNGTVTLQKQFNLSIPGKRAYGGVQKVPASLVSKLGGEYVVGWGGYTSLVAQGGGASIGPTMYAIPDPSQIANGSTVNVRAVLDCAGSRGYRKTLVKNYFDGGDARQNPSSPPSGDPLPTAAWLSPNSAGMGWMTWGDSYYNTGTWIGTDYVAIASLCKGRGWYQSSTLAFDGRQFELHQWDGNKLGNNITQRPDAMEELNLPAENAYVWGGNIPTGNVSGATYDPRTGVLFLVGYPLGEGVYNGRLFAFKVDGAVVEEPIPTPTDAVVGEWGEWVATSPWSECAGGTQSRTEMRTRAVLVPATNGGSTPELTQLRTSSQSCTEPQPEPTYTLVGRVFDRDLYVIETE